MQIELTGSELHDVTGRSRLEQCRAVTERLPELRDVHLKRSQSRVRWVLSPEVVYQTLCRDELVRVEKQGCEQRPLLRPGQAHFGASFAHLERAENPKLHA